MTGTVGAVKYDGIWKSLLFSSVHGTVSFTYISGQVETPAVFTFTGKAKHGETNNVILKIKPSERIMTYDNVTFNLDRFDDVILGSYSCSFPPDKGLFAASTKGLPVSHYLESGNQQDGGCNVM